MKEQLELLKNTTINIDSQTAEKIAENYIQYLYFEKITETALVGCFVFGLVFCLYKLVSSELNNRL